MRLIFQERSELEYVSSNCAASETKRYNVLRFQKRSALEFHNKIINCLTKYIHSIILYLTADDEQMNFNKISKGRINYG